MLTPFCCLNCGFWQKRFATPTTCPVCEDYRHPLPPDGYEFLTADEVAARQTVTHDEPMPGLHRFSTTPQLGIGSCGYLIRHPTGNVHFEGCGWYDDAALDRMADEGGVSFLAASHPHVYGALWRVVERFRPKVVVQAEALPFCQAFDVTVPFDEEYQLTAGMRLIRTAGHTPDHTVLYQPDRRRLYCGDALKFTFPAPGQTVGRPETISCHRAFDARIPLTRGDLLRYRSIMFPLDFDAVVSPWEVVTEGGRGMALRLFERQLHGDPTAEPLEI